MDDWALVGLLVGLGVLAGMILGPIAFFRDMGMQRRLDEAERRLAALNQAQAALASQHQDLLHRLAGAESQPRPAAPAILEAMRPQPAAVPAAPARPESPRPEQAAVQPTAIEAPVFKPLSGSGSPPAPSPQARTLEERLGAGWTVWTGGIALALGALLLVRYSIEAGLIGPAARVVTGLVLAAALVAAGEMLRRRDRAAAAGAVNIPAVLTAAGTVAAFGAIFAAHALYSFIGAGAAFVLLGATAFTAMLLAALHAPWLAGLGLAGALAVPLLVDSAHPDPWAAVSCIGLVAIAAYGLASLRGWRWLAIAVASGACLWGLVLAFGAGSLRPAVFSAAMVHNCLQITLAALAFGWSRSWKDLPGPVRLDVLGSLMPSLLAVPVFITLAIGGGGHSGMLWQSGALLAVALLAVSGRACAALAGALGAAGALALAVAAIWPGQADLWAMGEGRITAMPAYAAAGPFALHSAAMAAAAALPAGSGLFVKARTSAAVCLLQAGAACLTPLALLGMVWLRSHEAFSAGAFAAAAAGLAAGFTAAATALQARGAPASRFGLGAFAASGIAALALGLVFLLNCGMLTAALAMAAAGAALVASRLQIPALRWCAAGLGLLIAARLAWDPRIAGAALGQAPVFNWLLFGYGVPALAFAFAAFTLARAQAVEDIPLRLCQSLAIAFAALLVFFEIRHALNHGDPFAKSSSLAEQGLMSVSALAFAIITTRLDLARAGAVFRWASLGFGLASFATTAAGLGVLENPLFSDEVIEGGSFFNAILLSYALPGAMALFLARLSRGVRPEWYRLGAGFAALLLLFATASLEVRRGFMAAQIGIWRGFQQSEWYAYSLVWLLMGMALLAFGVWRSSIEARLVSALFVLAAVLKIFLFDLAGLDGVLRAFSFIGLGFVLIGIGLVYQKLVFKEGAAMLGRGKQN